METNPLPVDWFESHFFRDNVNDPQQPYRWFAKPLPSLTLSVVFFHEAETPHYRWASGFGCGAADTLDEAKQAAEASFIEYIDFSEKLEGARRG